MKNDDDNRFPWMTASEFVAWERERRHIIWQTREWETRPEVAAAGEAIGEARAREVGAIARIREAEATLARIEALANEEYGSGGVAAAMLADVGFATAWDEAHEALGLAKRQRADAARDLFKAANLRVRLGLERMREHEAWKRNARADSDTPGEPSHDGPNDGPNDGPSGD